MLTTVNNPSASQLTAPPRSILPDPAHKSSGKQMSILQLIRDQTKLKRRLLSMVGGPYTEGALLIVDPMMPCKVKQQSNLLHDFIPVNRLGHLMGPISISLEFISGMCSLLAGLASPKSEVCHHYDPIHPSPVDQCQQLCHLLHPIGTRSL